MGINEKPSQLKPADYATDQEVRWCPGCGDYAILNAVKKTLADNQSETKNTVFRKTRNFWKFEDLKKNREFRDFLKKKIHFVSIEKTSKNKIFKIQINFS